MTKVKICGIRCLDDVKFSNQLLPDFVGFVFFEKSKRFISFKTAKKLKMALCDSIKSVGVFVDADIKTIKLAVERGIIDLIQLHGDEDEKYISELKKVCDKPVIKAFVIKDKSDLKKAENTSADFVLLDAGRGDGETFDWSLLNGFSRKYFLAGGLNEKNVKEAVNTLAPFGVDVSSSVESDGKKDYLKMKKFINAVFGKTLEDT